MANKWWPKRENKRQKKPRWTTEDITLAALGLVKMYIHIPHESMGPKCIDVKKVDDSTIVVIFELPEGAGHQAFRATMEEIEIGD